MCRVDDSCVYVWFSCQFFYEFCNFSGARGHGEDDRHWRWREVAAGPPPGVRDGHRRSAGPGMQAFTQFVLFVCVFDEPALVQVTAPLSIDGSPSGFVILRGPPVARPVARRGRGRVGPCEHCHVASATVLHHFKLRRPFCARRFFPPS